MSSTFEAFTRNSGWSAAGFGKCAMAFVMGLRVRVAAMVLVFARDVGYVGLRRAEGVADR